MFRMCLLVVMLLLFLAHQVYGGRHRGMAPNAKIAFFGIGTVSAGLSVPTDLNTGLFPYGYAAGARVSCNAWGDPNNNGYGLGRHGLIPLPPGPHQTIVANRYVRPRRGHVHVRAQGLPASVRRRQLWVSLRCCRPR